MNVRHRFDAQREMCIDGLVTVQRRRPFGAEFCMTYEHVVNKSNEPFNFSQCF